MKTILIESEPNTFTSHLVTAAKRDAIYALATAPFMIEAPRLTVSATTDNNGNYTVEAQVISTAGSSQIRFEAVSLSEPPFSYLSVTHTDQQFTETFLAYHGQCYVVALDENGSELVRSESVSW